MIGVTGGAGFLGSHLVERLVAVGADVRVIERPGAIVNHLPLARIEVATADIRDRQAVQRAVKGCEQVYHLAGNPKLWTRRRADFDAVNHLGTVHVLEESLAAGARRVQHVSTESILVAKQPRTGPIETIRLRAEDMVGPYCLSKFRAEQFALQLAENGAPVVVVNPTLPVGPGDRGRSPPTQMTVAFCQGRLPAYVNCRFNMIDGRDVAAGMQLVMESGKPGRRYLLGSENLDLLRWLTLVGNAVGRQPPKWRVPFWLALAHGYASELVADCITGMPPMATVTGVKLSRYLMHFDAAQSLADIGLQPRPIEESARDAVAWYRSMSWI